LLQPRPESKLFDVSTYNALPTTDFIGKHTKRSSMFTYSKITLVSVWLGFFPLVYQHQAARQRRNPRNRQLSILKLSIQSTEPPCTPHHALPIIPSYVRKRLSHMTAFVARAAYKMPRELSLFFSSPRFSPRAGRKYHRRLISPADSCEQSLPPGSP